MGYAAIVHLKLLVRNGLGAPEIEASTSARPTHDSIDNVGLRPGLPAPENVTVNLIPGSSNVSGTPGEGTVWRQNNLIKPSTAESRSNVVVRPRSRSPIWGCQAEARARRCPRLQP